MFFHIVGFYKSPTSFDPTNLSYYFPTQSNKPIMEKRRRARINNSLNDLKTLVLESMKKDVSIPFTLTYSYLFSARAGAHVHKVSVGKVKFASKLCKRVLDIGGII